MVRLTETEKKKVLNYLEHGEVIAAGAGRVQNHATGKYTHLELIAYADGPWDWSNEDIFNLEMNDEIFDEDLVKYILQK